MEEQSKWVKKLFRIFQKLMRVLFILLRYFNPAGAHESALIGEIPFGKPQNLVPAITQTAIGKQKELLVFGD